MKKLWILFLLAACKPSAHEPAVQARVDQRVELLSIVARLAGYEEYNMNMAKDYVAAIQEHFKDFADDSLIRLTRRVREENAIGYDAVMFVAVNLRQQDNSFQLQPNWEKSMDERWNHRDVPEMLRLLNEFYKKSKAAQFFEAQQPYYTTALSRFDTVLADFDQDWYHRFYGVDPEEKFSIILGCANGGANYGPSIRDENGQREVFAIMGNWSFDSSGAPAFLKQDYQPILIHEFNHSFVNKLLENYQKNAMLTHGLQKIYDSLRDDMNKQAYADWENVFNESVVRASVVRYLIDHYPNDSARIETAIVDELNNSFVWTRELAELLGQYEANRKEYKEFGEFFPKIIQFFQQVSDNIGDYKAKVESSRPQVVRMEPFTNNAEKIDSRTSELTIYFNEPLTGPGYSVSAGKDSLYQYPVKSVVGYGTDRQSIKLALDLKPGTNYEFWLTGRSFRNKKGYRLRNFRVRFRTA